MRILTIIDEDFNHYKKPSMLISAISCDWKCCKEANIDESICQNNYLKNNDVVDIEEMDIVNRYSDNNVTNAVVIAGLEPFDQYDEMEYLIEKFRYNTADDIVIYTGYNEDELERELRRLTFYTNIIVKVGRYIPNQHPHYDEVLGVDLASDNQYGKVIS